MKKILFIFSLTFLVLLTGFAQNLELVKMSGDVVAKKESVRAGGERALMHASQENSDIQLQGLMPENFLPDGYKGPVGTNWMSWLKGETSSVVGAGANEFGIYHRFTAADLAPYVGKYITSIKYQPYSHSSYPTSFSAAPRIQVYKGATFTGAYATNDPGTLIADVVASDYSINFDNIVELPTPILIDGTEEIWFGVRYFPSATCYPAVSSSSTAPGTESYVADKSNIFYSGQYGVWGTTADFFTAPNTCHSWSIMAYVRDALPTETCSITVEMDDSYGDGWTESTLSFFDANNNEWAVITCNSYEETRTISLPTGYISCYWTPGPYAKEVSFVIKNSEGTAIYTCEEEDFENQAEGIFFTFKNTSCLTNPPADCDPVTNLAVSFNGADATIKWSAVTGATEYKVFLDYLEVATVTTPTYTFSDLENGNYLASVTPVYSGDCIPVRTDLPFTVLTCDNPPTDLAVAYNTDREAELTWSFDAGPGDPIMLWDQMNVGQTTSGFTSQQYGNGTSHTVDDFVLEANTTLTKITAQTGATSSVNLPTSLGIKIWDSKTDGTPNTLIHTITGFPYASGSITLDISSENIELDAGRYWLSVYGIGNTNYASTNAKYLWICGSDVVGLSPGYIYGSITNSVYGINNNTWYLLSSQSIKSAVFSVYGIPDFEPTFNVYRDGELIASGLTNPAYTDTDFDITQSHVWSVKATCLNGGETEAVSLEKEACFPLDPVVGLSANVVSTTVYLNWTAPGGGKGAASNMELEEKELSFKAHAALEQYIPDGGKALVNYEVFFNGTSLGTTTNTNYSVTGVEEGEHEYCVKVVYDEGTSEEVCVDVEVIAPAECNPVENLTAEYNSDCSVELAWDVPAKGGKAATVLWDNTDIAVSASGSGLISTSWTDTYVLVADDFDATAGWEIDKVVTSGFYSSTSATNATKLRIVIMSDDNNAPGTVLLDEVREFTVTGSWDHGNILAARLSEPYVVPSAGKYWIGVAVHFDIAKPASLNTARWNIFCGTTGIGAGFYLHDPSNLFNEGTNWMPAGALLGDGSASMYFQLLSPDPDLRFYNVYRDGVLVAEEIETTSYTDSGFDPQEPHSWTVTVVCEDGESEPVTVEKEYCMHPDCDELIIGTATTGNYNFPVCTYYNNSYTQQIYTAAELTDIPVGSYITSLSFEYYNATAYESNAITFYIGNTSKTSFGSTTDWAPLADMRKVFTGTVNFTNGSKWTTITFDTPYEYTGGNIVVAAIDNKGSYLGSASTFRHHTSAANQTMYFRSDTQQANPATTTHTGTRGATRNNIKFGYCPDYAYSSCEDELVTIDGPGNQSNAYTLPINNLYNYSYTQQIFDLEEIGGAGKISSIAFQYNYGTAFTNPIKIYLGNTTKSTFANTSDWVPVSELELVYDGSVTFAGLLTWVTIELDTPFDFTGDNLVVAVVDETDGYPGSTRVFRTNAIPSKALDSYRDSSPIDPASPISASYATVRAYRNNVQFNICIGGSIVTCPAATDLSVVFRSETATVSWEVEGNETFVWNVEIVSAGAAQGSGEMYTTNNTAYTFTDLDPDTQYSVYVQANCGGGDISKWTGPVSFRTDCTPVSDFPFAEGFEAVAIPDCWRQEYVVATQNWITRATNNNFPAPHEGSRNAAFPHGTTGATTKLVSPVFDFTGIDEAKLAFWHGQLNWGTDQDELRVYYKTSETSDWVLLEEYTNSIATWTRRVITLPELSDYYWIAFEAKDAWGYGVVLDDVVIYVPEYATLAGTVTHQGSPVEGATVEFHGAYTDYTVVTDAAGEYEIEAETGMYDATASKAGYHSADKYDEEVSQPITQIDFVLTAPDFYVAPEEIIVRTNYMVDGYAGVTLHNDGDGPVDWKLKIEYLDKSGKSSKPAGISYEEFLTQYPEYATGKTSGATTETEIASNVNVHTYDFGGKASNTVAWMVLAAATHQAVTIPLDDPSNHTVLGAAAPELPGGGDYINGEWYCIAPNSKNVYKVNSETGVFTSVANHAITSAIGMCHHPIEDVTYVKNSTEFYTVDVTTGATALKFTADRSLSCFAITNEGRFIALDLGNDVIVEINPETGATTVLFSLGFDANYIQDMAIDREDNIIYWAALNATASAGQLYTFDLENNSMSLVGALPGEMVAFAIPTELPGGWLSTETMAGSLEPGESQEVQFKMDGSWAEEGEWYANAKFTGTPGIEPANVFVTFIIDEFECLMPDDLQAEQVGGDVLLTWDVNEESMSPIEFEVYFDGALIGKTSKYYFTHTDVEIGDHEYCVKAACVEDLSESACVDIFVFAAGTYGITAKAEMGGTIDPEGFFVVEAGSTKAFSFAPYNNTYSIAQVLIDGVNDPSAVRNGYYAFVNIQAHHTITVIFEHSGYNITSTAGDYGTISPLGTTLVPAGQAQLYTFEANPGYETSQVLIDGVNNPGAVASNMYTFSNVSAPHTIHVNFAPKTYAITASATTGGTISPSGVTTVTYGGSQAYTFTASANYKLVQVLVDGVNDEAAVATGSYTFYNVANTHTIHVVFVANVYEITATAGEGGKISPSGTATVTYGSNKTYTIYPDEGFVIEQVLIDGVNNGSAVGSGTYTFTAIAANHTIEALFAPITFTITVNHYVDGVIDPQGEHEVVYGETPTFTFTPDAGHKIVDVLVDGESKPTAIYTGFYTFMPVTADHTLDIYFERTTLVITAIATGNGDIDPVGSVEVKYGDDQTFVFTPDEGYIVGSVIVDSELIAGATENFTFENVTENHTIEVVFEKEDGIDNVDISSLTIYPNPTKGELRIKNEDLKIQNIRVFDMAGRLMREVQNVDNAEYVLDISDFSNGVYFIDVDGRTKKVVKQ